MKIDRREILRFVAYGLPAWLGLCHLHQRDEPPPVRLTADFEAAFEGSVKRQTPKIHDVGVKFAGKAEASFALSLDVIKAS